MPRPRQPLHPFLDAPPPLAFAHRGGAAEHPENTMAAFSACVALGYRYLETDVRVTLDGVAVAFHDERLDRVTDRSGVLGRLSWGEVRSATVGGEPLARLEDVLGAWPDVRVTVDVKTARAVGPLVQVLRRTRALDRVCVGSFSERRLGAVRRALGPAACLSLGPRGVAALRAVSRRRLPARVVPAAECAQVPVAFGPLRVVTPALVATAHRLGLPVQVWTIDEEAEMRRLLDLGVDALMTDRPTLLREVLRSRGVWGR